MSSYLANTISLFLSTWLEFKLKFYIEFSPDKPKIFWDFGRLFGGIPPRTMTRWRHQRSGERGAELIPPKWKWHQRKLLAGMAASQLPFPTMWDGSKNDNLMLKFWLEIYRREETLDPFPNQPSSPNDLSKPTHDHTNPNKQVWNAGKKGGEAGRDPV